jgi:hypothetical protein
MRPGEDPILSTTGHLSSRGPVLIEEMHEKGAPLERALPDAGIERIRPVMITVWSEHRRVPENPAQTQKPALLSQEERSR